MALARVSLTAVLAFALIATAMPGVAAEGVTAESLFQRAETLFVQLDAVDPSVEDPASWEALAEVFAAVPERFPTDPLAGHALWRLAEIRVREDRAGVPSARVQATTALELLITRYPTSRFAPAAYLRLADLGSGAEARSRYYRLLREYPGSPEAERARERLTALADGVEPEPRPESETTDLSDQDPADEVPEASPTPASRTSPSAVAPEIESVPLDPPSVDEAERAEAPDPASATSESGLGRLLGVRHYSDDTVTRVVLDLDRSLQHEIGEAQGPPRVFVDLIGAELPTDVDPDLEIPGPGVDRVRAGVNRPGVVRVVLDLEREARYSFFTLSGPDRLVVDIPTAEISERLATARRPPAPEGGAEARQLNLGIRRVVIDPGHGGTAPGAIGRSGTTEKELTLDIANRLADNLRSSGYEVLLTRDADESIPLEERPVLATRSGADLFVSIHINSSTNRRLSGFETYYLDLATDPTAAETAARENAGAEGGLGGLDNLLDEIVKNANKRESRDLAHSIQDSLVLQMTRQHDDIRDLGVKHAPFIVLVGAQMPAVLVECSFLSHDREEQRLRDPDYRQRVADAIHIGIENYSAKRRMLTATH